MSNTADNHRAPQDVAFKPAGVGLALRLPADPRWPSFSATPPGWDPATGKPWERRA